MTGPADAFLAAARAFDAVPGGRLLWSVNGWRAYAQQAGEVYRLTLVGGGWPSLTYEVIGVNPLALE